MVQTDYDKTPSFFNTEEGFEKYLGRTSYYVNLQKNVKRLIALAKPASVLELGSATGGTTNMLASEFPSIKFQGVDMRSDVVKIAEKAAKEVKLTNVTFSCEDMLELAKSSISSKFIFMLYSFHHIVDPLEVKVEFLRNMRKNMKAGAYLCIAETFLPDELKSITEDKEEILALWERRKREGFSSTFWESLESLSTPGIIEAVSVGNYCEHNEGLAGGLVADRQDEYLIQPKWLVNTAKEIGFKVKLSMPVNDIGDRVVLLQK